MLALHHIGRRHRHVVTKIVETEFVVRTESDVAVVGRTTGSSVGLVLVNAIDSRTVEHVERSHPLGVTFREVVVDCHNMHTAS